MKKLLLAALTLICFSALNAQPVQTIRGTITDAQSKTPLIGATVVLLGSEPLIGTTSDMDGKFRLEAVPTGRHSIRITYVGYTEVVLSNLIVNSAKEVVLTIEMEEAVIAGAEAVVTATEKGGPNNELVSVSGRKFSIDETQRYAGSLGDPSRMASNFAGVVGGGNDQRNDIVIRGNSPLGMLWRLEGADIPNPNHFSNQGANGGPVSILNNNTLANSDFLTGAWPAEYGAATSGVFDLKMRNGNNEKREHTFQIGFNGLELMTEGPLTKNGASYLFSYRYSTLSFFDAIGIQFGNSGIPFYQDFSLKVNVPTQKAGTFSLWGIGGLSSTDIFDSGKDSAERADKVRPEDIRFSSGMFATGVTHLLPVGKKGYVKSVLSFSGEKNETILDTLVNETSGTEKALYFHSDSRVFKTALHSFYNHKFNARNSLKTGFILSRFSLNMDDSLRRWESQRPSGFRVNYAINESAWTWQAYSNWTHKFSSRLTLNAGLHAQGLLLNNIWSLEPRAGIKYDLDSRSRISFGYGLHGQGQPLPVYFQETNLDNGATIRTNTNLKYTRNHHFVLGYERQIAKSMRLKTETYYQYLNNVAVTESPSAYSIINFGSDFSGLPNIDSLTNKGLGRNYGLEITLEKFFSKGYYFLITSSFYQSEYMGSDGKWRSTAYNGNYVINALGGKEFTLKKGQVLAFNFKGTWAGGRREIPIDFVESAIEKRAVYDLDRAYETRLPDYLRFDVRIGFKINGKRVTQEWALDLQNVFNIRNILTRQYDPASGELRDQYQIGIFPVPLYRLQF